VTVRLVITAFAELSMLGIAGTACAQSYPTHAVRVITAETRGGDDLGARLIAQGLSTSFNANVFVDNRPVSQMGDIVAKSPPDGYTLLICAGALWIAPLIQKTLYDPVQDFAPISMVSSAPNVLVVHPDLPVRSVKALIALAKAKPGALNYGSGGTGTSPQLSAELFKSMAGGLNIVHVPYRGSGPAINDLLGGYIQLMFPNMQAAAPHIRSGKLRALAITTLERSALAPDLPTVAASGLPGFESAQKLGMFAPAKTPAAIVRRLNQETVRILNQPDVKEKFLVTGAEVGTSTPEQFAANIKSEMARWGKLIQALGIREY
jgi:tripartite-type tricarboxylate transporter receptor subunit TctC